MKTSGTTLRIGIAATIIVGTIGWLAISGYGASKSYYVTVAELGRMGDKAYTSRLRVEGFVRPGSIAQNGTHVDFVLDEFESHSPKAATGRVLKVIYKGSEPPPDTFMADAQALAEGSYGRDGVFYANTLQAKCASKYEPAQPNSSRPRQEAVKPAPNSRTAVATASLRSSNSPATN
jgi:cytochrome c-type biogenesis protein CcmE